MVKAVLRTTICVQCHGTGCARYLLLGANEEEPRRRQHQQHSMTRLADYFVVVGYDHNEKRPDGSRKGIHLKRFPEKDWPDVPFDGIDSIERFCQPQGWRLSTQRQQPSFFVFVLTDMSGNRLHCACLCFYEPIAIQPTRHDEEIDDESINSGSIDGQSVTAYTIASNSSSGSGGGGHHSIMYAPKCLVLISRFDYKTALKVTIHLCVVMFFISLSIHLYARFI